MDMTDATSYNAMMPHMERYVAMLYGERTQSHTTSGQYAASPTSHRAALNYRATPSSRGSKYLGNTSIDMKIPFLLGIGYGMGMRDAKNKETKDSAMKHCQTCSCGEHGGDDAGEYKGADTLYIPGMLERATYNAKQGGLEDKVGYGIPSGNERRDYKSYGE